MVVAKLNNALHLSAVDRKATALGLTIGQPLANARAMLPALKAVSENPAEDHRLLARIADWCDRFTPFVAFDSPRCLLLDVTGASHLFGGEQAMLNTVRNSLKAQGFALRASLAGTATAARALARYRDGTVIAAGEEARAMLPLPIEALNLDAVTTHAFRRAGLKTVGQAASRKRTEMTARFGAAMVATLDAALGIGEKPISPRRPQPEYVREKNFPEPVFMQDFIRQTLKDLSGELSLLLERRGEGARQLEAIFFRADGAVRRIAIEMGAPTRDPAVIDRLFSEKLAALTDPLDPGFGFDLIRLAAHRVESFTAEAIDLVAAVQAKAELGFLVDRLAARFGSNRILSFQPNDTHIPEAAWSTVPAQFCNPSKISWKKPVNPRDAPRRPLRLFARPEPVAFEPPKNFNWRKSFREVVRYQGPERIAMEWWRHQTIPPTRDYFRMEDGEGRRYWLYRNGVATRDGQEPKWFVHGTFA